MTYTWAIGRVKAKSERGKQVIAHASLGSGYVLLNDSIGDDVLYAVRWPNYEPIPEHLTEARRDLLPKIEKKYKSMGNFFQSYTKLDDK